MADANYDVVKKILSDNGFSWTKSREAVFGSLTNNNPLTIKEIIDKVAGRVDRVSVYRVIELFEKLGIAHRINIGWKYKIELSDQFIAHHHHLSCLRCGRVIDIEDEKHIDHFIGEVADRFGFQPQRHQFEIEGLCAECLKAK